MNYLDLFAGIGGFHLGLKQAGFTFEWIGFSEIYEPAIKIYKKHYSEAIELGNIESIHGDKLPNIDIITGGFPCQNISYAGDRRGLRGDNSSLWREMARIIRETNPKVVLVENVKGLLSSTNCEDLVEIVVTLAEMGYDCQWELLDSRYFGLAQKRERVFIVSTRTKPFIQIFPLDPCMCRNRPANEIAEPPAYAHCISTREGQRQDPSAETFIASTIRRNYNKQFNGAGYDNIIAEIDAVGNRTIDGIPRRMDGYRYRCLGNAVCPPIVKAIGEALMAGERSSVKEVKK